MSKEIKLHEELAVEGNHESQWMKCQAELIETFNKRRHHFEEKKITVFPLGEGQQPTIEGQSDIQTTVDKELKWISEFIVKAWDSSYRVAEANTSARADIVLEDGTVLVEQVPATALLELEKRVNNLQTLITNIPTLDPARGFRPDADRGNGIFQAREVTKPRTRKEKKILIKYEATKEHPAQTEVIEQDTVVAKIQEQEWSSLITPARKSELLTRVEVLARAVRRARSRANEVPVNRDAKIAEKLLSFVFAK